LYPELYQPVGNKKYVQQNNDRKGKAKKGQYPEALGGNVFGGNGSQ